MEYRLRGDVLHERGVNTQMTRLKIASAIASLKIRVTTKEINEAEMRQEAEALYERSFTETPRQSKRCILC